MATEIERKFLVDLDLLGPLEAGTEMIQAYISTGESAVVRVRLAGDEAWLTLKGRNTGAVRSEFEYPIPVQDARQMIEEFCAGRVISKTRYLREHEKLPVGDRCLCRGKYRPGGGRGRVV